jgi:hypothetical protein
MQVVDLASGRVVWRGLMEPYHHGGAWSYVASEAGPPIGHEDELLARRIATAMLSGQKPTEVPAPEQEVLF